MKWAAIIAILLAAATFLLIEKVECREFRDTEMCLVALDCELTEDGYKYYDYCRKKQEGIHVRTARILSSNF